MGVVGKHILPNIAYLKLYVTSKFTVNFLTFLYGPVPILMLRACPWEMWCNKWGGGVGGTQLKNPKQQMGFGNMWIKIGRFFFSSFCIKSTVLTCNC